MIEFLGSCVANLVCFLQWQWLSPTAPRRFSQQSLPVSYVYESVIFLYLILPSLSWLLLCSLSRLLGKSPHTRVTGSGNLTWENLVSPKNFIIYSHSSLIPPSFNLASSSSPERREAHLFLSLLKAQSAGVNFVVVCILVFLTWVNVFWDIPFLLRFPSCLALFSGESSCSFCPCLLLGLLPQPHCASLSLYLSIFPLYLALSFSFAPYLVPPPILLKGYYTFYTCNQNTRLDGRDGLRGRLGDQRHLLWDITYSPFPIFNSLPKNTHTPMSEKESGACLTVSHFTTTSLTLLSLPPPSFICLCLYYYYLLCNGQCCPKNCSQPMSMTFSKQNTTNGGRHLFLPLSIHPCKVGDSFQIGSMTLQPPLIQSQFGSTFISAYLPAFPSLPSPLPFPSPFFYFSHNHSIFLTFLPLKQTQHLPHIQDSPLRILEIPNSHASH